MLIGLADSGFLGVARAALGLRNMISNADIGFPAVKRGANSQRLRIVCALLVLIDISAGNIGHRTSACSGAYRQRLYIACAVLVLIDTIN